MISDAEGIATTSAFWGNALDADFPSDLESCHRANATIIWRHRVADQQEGKHPHISTTLAAHDLKSPIFGVRNALLATRQAVIEGSIARQDLAEGLEAMEDASSTLLDRTVGILPKPEADTEKAKPGDPGYLRA